MLRRFSDAAEATMKAIVVVSMIVLVGCVFLQVFSRYLLMSSVPWTEELARYALVYLTFAGAAIATRKGVNIRVDFVVDLLPDRAKFALSCLSDILLAGVSAMLIWYGGRFAYLSRNTVSPALDTSMAWVNAALPAAGVLIFLWSIAGLAGRIADRTKSRNGNS